MILYHGSYLAVEKPDLSFSRDNIDFGKGFYTTPIREQAEKWTERFRRRKRSRVLSAYEFDESVLQSGASILRFDSYSEGWLDFIVNCRSGNDKSDYDLVIGGVANDDVFTTLTLFFKELIDKKTAIKRLTYQKPNIQYCFRSQAIMDNHLHFLSSEVMK
jgi:hypothetical protein